MKRIAVVLLLCVFNALAFVGPTAGTARRSDAEIEATIRTKLAKSKIGKDGFTVHVKNGIATWQGSTAVMQHKGAATRMAKTAGAVQVVNNIKITDESGAPRRVGVKQESKQEK